MQSDITLIKQTVDGNMVTMPLFVYEEIRAFCRQHGETDLPGFAEFVEFVDLKSGKEFKAPLSGSVWGLPDEIRKKKNQTNE